MLPLYRVSTRRRDSSGLHSRRLAHSIGLSAGKGVIDLGVHSESFAEDSHNTVLAK